jgi:hypothetical protein
VKELAEDKDVVSQKVFVEYHRFIRYKVPDYHPNIFIPPVALRPNVGHGVLILEVPTSHTTHHSLQDWTSVRLVVGDTST